MVITANGKATQICYVGKMKVISKMKWLLKNHTAALMWQDYSIVEK